MGGLSELSNRNMDNQKQLLFFYQLKIKRNFSYYFRLAGRQKFYRILIIHWWPIIPRSWHRCWAAFGQVEVTWWVLAPKWPWPGSHLGFFSSFGQRNSSIVLKILKIPVNVSKSFIDPTTLSRCRRCPYLGRAQTMLPVFGIRHSMQTHTSTKKAVPCIDLCFKDLRTNQKSDMSTLLGETIKEDL